jgi:hypothetical protein
MARAGQTENGISAAESCLVMNLQNDRPDQLPAIDATTPWQERSPEMQRIGLSRRRHGCCDD